MKKFSNYIKDLDVSLKQLCNCIPAKKADLPESSGVYLLSEEKKPLYIGRTKNIKQRIQNHTRENHNQASFAFQLARESSGETKASYTKERSRKKLMEDENFKQHFEEAINRIKKMDIRYLEENCPIRQTLLEIYCAVELDTPYNHFTTS